MLKDLFVNTMILISFISFAQQLFRDRDLNRSSPLYMKVLIGLATGFLGILLMLFSIHVDRNVIVDFRHIPVILVSIIGGPVPTIISSIAIGIFRILYFGLSKSSTTAFLGSLLMAIGFSIISTLKVSTRQKWVYSVLYYLIVSSTVFIFLLLGSPTLINILIAYWIGSLIVTFLVYHYVQYLEHLTKLYRKFKDESSKDFLTGLNSVRRFDTFFNTLADNIQAKNERLSLLYIDIDFFKKINDTYGHSNGDIVLSELGCILTKTCRSFDFVSRNGGEEFSVLLLDCEATQALEIAERIRKAIEMYEFKLLDGKSIKITVSIGAATFPDITTNIQDLINHADTALYSAKKSGRNRVVLFNNTSCYTLSFNKIEIT